MGVAVRSSGQFPLWAIAGVSVVVAMSMLRLSMKTHGWLLLLGILFLAAETAKAEVLIPVSRVTQVARTTAIPVGTHSSGLAPVYPYPYPYPNPYPYPYYGGYPRYNSFSFGISIGGFGGFGRPFFGPRGCRRCCRPVSRCRVARRRCF